MTMMIAEVYDALTDAGASKEKAEAAAKAVAQYDHDIYEVKADLHLLKWMVGFNLAFTMAMLWRIFSPS
ncbi:MAG: hypothetical protein R8J85_04135 [Mariprofundales bacterium]